MKKLLSLLMLVGILAVSCGKEQDGSTTNGGQNIAPSFSFAQASFSPREVLTACKGAVRFLMILPSGELYV